MYVHTCSHVSIILLTLNIPTGIFIFHLQRSKFKQIWLSYISAKIKNCLCKRAANKNRGRMRSASVQETKQRKAETWLHQQGILLREQRKNTSRRKSIGWMSLSRANKPRAREELSMQFSRGYSRDTCMKKEEEEEAEEDEEEEKKIVRRGIGNVSPTYNRQGVDSRLLDLRQSNFANETYPVTQLAFTRRAHVCTHVCT